MKNPLHTYAQETRLTDREKDALHARILTYMEYHPRQYTAHTRTSSQISTYITQAFLSMRGLAAFGALAVFTFTAVPYFAESAQPGDLLYAIKTGVNEPLRSITLTTATEKISFETKLLERRVAEAKLLVAEGKLDADAEERLSANIKKHSDTIQKNIEELKETDTENADVAQTEFTSILGTTDTIVSALTDIDESASTSTLRQVLTDARTDAEQKATSTNPAARERILGRIEQELARAYELRTSVEKDLSVEETAEVERRFAHIESILRTSTSTATTTPEPALMTMSVSEPATTTPILETKITHDYEILSQVKTLIVYLTDTSMRSRLSTGPEVTLPLMPAEAEATTTLPTIDIATTTAPLP